MVATNKAIKEVGKMKLNVAKIRKVFTIILTIIVFLLVVFAVYTNKSRFYSTETVRYSLITIDEKTDIQEIIRQYSNQDNKERFISEIKKVNGLPDLSEEEIYGRTIYIPLISN